MAEIKKQPEWVHDRSWEDYQSALTYVKFVREYGGDLYREASTELLEKLLRDPGCKCVWRIMNSSKSTATMGDLLIAIERALRGPLKSTLITNEDRKKLADKVTSNARSLRTAIHTVQKRGDIPDQMFDQVADRMIAALATHGAMNVTMTTLNRGQEQLFHMSVRLAVRDLFFDDRRESILSALEKGAEAWSRTKAFEHRVKGNDLAKQRFFALGMKDFSEAFFGKTHNSFIGALTNCLFGTTWNSSEVGRKLKKDPRAPDLTDLELDGDLERI